MSTYLFSDVTSEQSMNIYPAQELDPDKLYTISLISLSTYNTIANVNSTNNKLHYDDKSMTIPEGHYEIDDINRVIRTHLGVEYKNNEYFHKLLKEKSVKPSDNFFNIYPNPNTLKCSVLSSHTIDFTKENSIGKLLGFKSRVLSPLEIHESDNTVNIFDINYINVECNIAMGSVVNGVPTHSIYTFYPDVAPGFKINERPAKPIAYPINTRFINNITIKIVDQLGRLVDFRGELISLQVLIDSY